MRTSSLNSINPICMSCEEGERELVKAVTPDCKTEMKSGALQESITQPLLTNPGSIENSRISTRASLERSIAEYKMKRSKEEGRLIRENEIVSYMLAINSRMSPAIFSDDLLSHEGKVYVRCWTNFSEFTNDFIQRKERFQNQEYQSTMIGMFNGVDDKKNAIKVNGSFYLLYKFLDPLTKEAFII